jgi:putative inorganic carbon (hco3(-)) transporter
MTWQAPAMEVGSRVPGPLVRVLAAALGGVAVGLFVALGPAPLLVVAGLAGLLVTVVILGAPELSIPVAIGILYSNAIVVGAQVHGAPIGLALVIPALLAIPVLHRIAARREPVVGIPLMGLAGLYLVVLLLSALAARDPQAASEEVWRFATEGMLLFVLLLQGIRSSRILWAIIGVLLVVGGVLGLISVIQQATGSFDETFLGFGRTSSRGFAFLGEEGQVIQRRVGGPIGEQNRYAQVMLALVPLGIVALRQAPRTAIRVAVLVPLLLIIAAVILTYSRGALVAAGIMLVALVAMRMINRRGLLLAAAACLLAVLAVPGLLERVATLEEATVSGGGDPVIAQRLNDMVSAALVFADHPLLGVGPGQFSRVYLEVASRAPGRAGTLDFEAHTLYGEVAAETGVLGWITFFTLIGGTSWLLVRARRAAIRVGRHDLADLAAGFVLVIVVHLGTGLFLHLSYPRYFWVMIGLAAATALVVRRESGAAEGATAPAIPSRPAYRQARVNRQGA